MPSNVPIAASGLFAAKKQAQALQNQNALLIDRIGQAKQRTANQRAQSSNIDSNKFVSMGKATPFDGNNVYGKCKMTIVNGNIVYDDMK